MKRYLIALIAIVAMLRFCNLGFNSLWLDEAYTFHFASMSWADIWNATANGEFNPPGFYWLEHAMLYFGNSEVVLRFLPAVFGVLEIPVIYFLGKELKSARFGLIMAALLTFSSFGIFYSQEARAYSLILLLMSAAFLCWLKWMRGEHVIKNELVFILLSALAFWCHFYAVIFFGVLSVYAAVKIDYRRIWNIPVSLILIAIPFAALTSPLLFIMPNLLSLRTANIPNFGNQGIAFPLQMFIQFGGMIFNDAIIAFGLFMAGAVFLYRKSKSLFTMLSILFTVPIVISMALSYKIPMMPRYVVFLYPIFLFFIAVVFETLIDKLSKYKVPAFIFGLAVLICIVSLSLQFLRIYYTQYTKEDWRGLAGYLEVHPALTAVFPDYVGVTLGYYYQGGNAVYCHTPAEYISSNATYYVVTDDVYAADNTGTVVQWIQDNTVEVFGGLGLKAYERK